MVKGLFDTSILVAALVADHPQHFYCFPWLQRVKSGEIIGVVSTHSLAELYSVLTRSPLPQPIKPKLAERLLAENLKTFEKVSLTAEDYQTTINLMVKLNIPGGAIYDALIAQAAIKSNVDILLTLNPKHFIRLGEAIARLITVPE